MLREKNPREQRLLKVPPRRCFRSEFLLIRTGDALDVILEGRRNMGIIKIMCTRNSSSWS
jgi:hypothetical protein